MSRRHELRTLLRGSLRPPENDSAFLLDVHRRAVPRDRMARLKSATSDIEKLRPTISKAHMEKIHARLKELISTQVDADRVLQEAALMAERGSRRTGSGSVGSISCRGIQRFVAH